MLRLQSERPAPNKQQLLADLIGQPFPSTSTVFTKGSLYTSNPVVLINFINLAYNAAVEEGLGGNYPGGGT